jgi:outer membrane murein-binding lipoprotein Lpp
VSYSPGVGADTSIGLVVGHKEPVDLSVSRADRNACLVIGAHIAEIRLEDNHLEVLRDRIPGVLAELGALDAASERHANAAYRADELETDLRERAVAALRIGDRDRADELSGVADLLKAAVDALEKALGIVEEAALAADEMSEDAKRLLDAQACRAGSAEAELVRNGQVG